MKAFAAALYILALVGMSFALLSCSGASSGNTPSPTKIPSDTVDTLAPAAPAVISPSSNPYSSSESTISLIGSCENSATVSLAGADTQTVQCSGGSFSFSINKTVDNTYNFTVLQTDVAGNSSPSSSFQWIRNSTIPPVPTIGSPAATPFYDNGSSLTVSGSCVSGNTVNLSGSSSDSTACASGSFSFSISKSTDATYTFSIVQVDSSSLSSGSATVVWVRDTVAPAVPTVVSPASSPLVSNSGSITIQGACETNATVNVSGSAKQSQTCSSSSYNFLINNSSDGTYTYNISQTDRASNVSTSVSQVWTRDTAAPANLTLTTPSSNPFTSSDTNITIGGTCESNATVSLSGDSTGSTTCASGSFSFNVSKSTDATYNFSLLQTDVAGNASSSIGFQWTRNSSTPTTPTITSPSATPFSSNSSSLTISGACTGSYTVELAGDDTQSQTCSAGSYSFTVSKSTDASYSFTVRQKSPSDIYSAQASQTWVRDTVSPSNPTITSPSSNPVYSNGSSILISGACEINAAVYLSGDSTSSMTCVAGSYSFSINKSSDFSYGFSVRQTDLAGNNSGFLTQTWIRDTSSPTTLTIVTPNTNPYTSSGNLSVQGVCETGATVSLQEYTDTGRTTATGSAITTACAASSYSLSFPKSSDATYYLGLKQVDLANNSSAEINQDWTRNSTVMVTPVVSFGGSTVVAPIYTNTASIVLRATCTTGANNSIFTSASSVTPANSISCASASYGDFTVSESSDGSYAYTFWQEDSATPANSASYTVNWTKDTLAPSAPVILSPGTSPYTSPGNLTLSGTCETGATVNLSGDSTSSITCAAGAFTFSISKSTDATYNFSLSQTDLASNASSSTAFQWIRNTASVPPPTIVTPSSNVTNNSSTLTISGLCNTGYTVTLAGYGSATLSNPSTAAQTCVGGTFSYTLTLSSDAVLSLSLKQTFSATDSSLATLTWTRDTVAPTVSYSVSPPAIVLQSLVNFSFSANETVTGFECRLDSGSYAACTSPYTLSSVSNGNHIFYVRATDVAGNVSAGTSVSWDQQAYNALAIYHLDTSDITLNSSSYFGAYEGTLAVNGSPTLISAGKFGQGRGLSSGNNYSVPNNDALSVATAAITIEGYWQGFSSITSAATGTTWTLVSKNGNSSGSYGWELQLYKTTGTNTSNTRCRLQIKLTTDSNVAPTLIAGGTAFRCGSSTSTWNYFAVKWSAASSGVVNFYGTPTASTTFTNFGTGTFGGTTTALGTNTSSVTIGTGGSATAWPGGIDEVRISQTARSISATPTAAFTAD